MPYGIGVEYPKFSINIGTLVRSANNLGAAFVFTIGRRYVRQCSDTQKVWSKIPIWHFETWEEYRAHAPFGWIPIAVEFSANGSRNLLTFTHPRCAVYWLGSEDNGLSQQARSRASYCVTIPTPHCLNVATSGSLVMYDRWVKEAWTHRNEPS